MIVTQIKWMVTVASLILVGIGAYNYGVNTTEIRYQKKINEFKDEQDKLILQLSEAMQELNQRSADNVRTIYLEADDDCLDSPIPDGLRPLFDEARN